MTESKRLVLWRHGQTIWNTEGRFQGQTDIPLDETGEAQAASAASRLATLRPDAIFSSDLSRASGTAARLSRLTGLAITLDKDLRERSGGSWEGLTDAEIAVRFPAERATWEPPDGESTTAVADRVGAALHRVAAQVPDGGLAVVVSHGAALRLGMARILGLTDDVFGVLGPLSNCSWSVLGLRNGRWRLLEHNAGTLPEPVLSDDR
ncbi:histidine phosphatase family protein [Trebonia sp.]|uniref:histidine phosphatase family protein n=1 Tax=Trebonia sp. TaxID=2767075 RepID=UPI00261F35ED|nr:histidine phosphatase family protein [Trebonia sp.]